MSERVLLVDDDLLVLQSTSLLLRSAGFEVTAAPGGEEGVERARAERPDVILLDIMMPRVDGWETLSRLRADPSTATVPVVMFTAREHARGRRLARSMGATEYLAKPFEPDELIELITRLAAGAASVG